MKLSVIGLFALLASSSAFAAPSWINCEGETSQVKLEITAGQESLYVGHVASSPVQAKIIQFTRSRCPFCYSVEAESSNNLSFLQLKIRGVRDGVGFKPTGMLTSTSKKTGKKRNERLVCRMIRAVP
jgi:hypothetical protein